MKRREFIIQSLSASAVLIGTGYASLDMLFYRTKRFEKHIEDRGTHAAAKVLTSENPFSDEGIMSPEVLNSLIPNVPEPKLLSRPAMAFQQNKAEAWLSPSNDPNKVATDIFQAPIEEIVLTEAQKTQTENVTLAKLEDSASSIQEKVANFETNFKDDVLLTKENYKLLVQTLERVNRVQEYVGFGNFNVISFDEAIKYAKYSPRIGAFTEGELAFLEMLFNYDSSQLGFFGEKVVGKLTNVVASKDIVKMPGTGHFVFRGHSEDFYRKIRKEVGDSLVLTSGVRNIVKQYQLFMAKTVQASGNLSRASRSLAPPGHSYHAIGDFDVGRKGGGFDNFTIAFAKTDEFKRLQDLGYVQIRYTANNDLGVRYEPWHIRVV